MFSLFRKAKWQETSPKITENQFSENSLCKFKVGKTKMIGILTESGPKVFEAKCPHQEADLQVQGFVKKGLIVCDLHKFKFSLTGASQQQACGNLAKYEARFNNGVLEVLF